MSFDDPWTDVHLKFARALTTFSQAATTITAGIDVLRRSCSAERLLTSFAACDREVAGWKTRVATCVAAMQCTDQVGRLALA